MGPYVGRDAVWPASADARPVASLTQTASPVPSTASTTAIAAALGVGGAGEDVLHALPVVDPELHNAAAAAVTAENELSSKVLGSMVRGEWLLVVCAML
jgi:hypothetical protein